MSTWITVVETATYLRTAETLLSDAERSAVVEMVARDPEVGNLIQGTGGLRKVRIPLSGRGKRGGGRLITYFHDAGMPAFLVALYAKNVSGDLNQQQRITAVKLTAAIRSQYRR